MQRIISLFVSFLIISFPFATVKASPPGSGPCVIKGVPPPLPVVTLEVVVKGLADPVHITNAGDRSGRLFITEQAGIIRILKGGMLLPASFLYNAHPNARPEIWAYGLCNPWRFSFDPSTGVLYAGDVGQYDREEIDIIAPGENYGWNIMEGTICTPGVNPKCNKTALVPPLIDYGRNEGITVIGGFVYRGQDIPPLCGAYIYGDWGSGKIWALRHQGHKVIEQRMLLDTRLSISSFGIDENYEVYVVDHKGGVYKIKRF